MSNKKSFFLTLVLGLTLSGEGMITIALTWSVLQQKGSIVHLGVVLAIMSIIPFLLQRYIKILNQVIKQKPLQTFAVLRTITLVLLLLMISLFTINLFSLYIFAGVMSCIIFLSMQSIETFMSLQVLNKSLQPHKAAALLQTAIQSGAFLGNAIGGIILSFYQFEGILLALLVCFAIGMLTSFFVKDSKPIPQPNTSNEDKSEISLDNKNITKSRISILLCSTLSIGFLTVQLASFNFSVPIIFHDIKSWDAALYGIVSAMAGVGALLATFLQKKVKALNFIFVFIFICNFIIANSEFQIFIIIMSFLLGFVLNYTRIIMRSYIFEQVKGTEEANKWSSLVTLVTQFSKSGTPLILSLIILLFGKAAVSTIFPIVGALVVLFIGITTYIRTTNSKESLLKEQKVNI